MNLFGTCGQNKREKYSKKFAIETVWRNFVDKRSEFSSKIGFVMAAAGSAVGLGNIWRFPYLAAKYGGGLFLIIYLIFVLTLGFAIMTAELAIGRKAQLSPMGAYRALDKRFSFVGIIASLVAFLILPYYSVIGGWVIKYFAVFVTGGAIATTGVDYFSNYVARPIEPIVWQSIFVLATTFVVIRGVKDGIEKASKILMPILIVMSVFCRSIRLCSRVPWPGFGTFFTRIWPISVFRLYWPRWGRCFTRCPWLWGLWLPMGLISAKKTIWKLRLNKLKCLMPGLPFWQDL